MNPRQGATGVVTVVALFLFTLCLKCSAFFVHVSKTERTLPLMLGRSKAIGTTAARKMSNLTASFGHTCCSARREAPCRQTAPVVVRRLYCCPYTGGKISSTKHARGNGAHPPAVLSAAGDGQGDEESNNTLLLRMDFEHAEVQELRKWIRRYPFGSALPVQPFSIVETETGVDVFFRKKPTLERSSQDGGLCFTVEDSLVEEEVDLPVGPTLTMRRISEGQAIRKMFAERIVVKAVVKSLAGDDAPPGTKVRTVLHEGLI